MRGTRQRPDQLGKLTYQYKQSRRLKRDIRAALRAARATEARAAAILEELA